MGMLLPNRHGSIDTYRYGFNGMEKDDEVSGEGNSYDFGARIYDPRVGRWFKTDNKEHEFSFLSPYIFASNNPIFYIDPDGNKFVNPYARELKGYSVYYANQKKIYDDMKSANNGKLRGKHKRAWKRIQKRYNDLESSAKYVDRYIQTLKTIDNESYTYFEELVDANGDEVNIEIFNTSRKALGSSGGRASIDSGTRARTELSPSYTDAVRNEKGELISYNIDGVRNNKINIYLFEQDLESFANELGDIKFFFETLVMPNDSSKDKEKYKYLGSTSGPLLLMEKGITHIIMTRMVLVKSLLLLNMK